MTQPAPSPVPEDRHPATRQVLRHFGFAHLPPHLAAVSAEFHTLAHALLGLVHDGPELTVALRKLREAKDCAVLQAVDDRAGADGELPPPVSGTVPAGQGSFTPADRDAEIAALRARLAELTARGETPALG